MSPTLAAQFSLKISEEIYFSLEPQLSGKYNFSPGAGHSAINNKASTEPRCKAVVLNPPNAATLQLSSSRCVTLNHKTIFIATPSL